VVVLFVVVVEDVHAASAANAAAPRNLAFIRVSA
jgi:hypothetical protein